MATSAADVNTGVAQAADPVDQPRGGGQTIALLMCAAFVVVLNETIMGVALPTLMTELSS
jgi:DHA2 family lincomycin resistance protein-like MFS transporter